MYVFIFLCRYLDRVKTFWAALSTCQCPKKFDSLSKHSTIKLRWRDYVLCGEMHSSVFIGYSTNANFSACHANFSACHVIISLQSSIII